MFTTHQCMDWDNTQSSFSIGIILFIYKTSSNRNIFCVTGLLWGESNDHRWNPSQRPVMRSWYFIWSSPEQTVKQTIEMPVIWDAIALIMRHCNFLANVSQRWYDSTHRKPHSVQTGTGKVHSITVGLRITKSLNAYEIPYHWTYIWSRLVQILHYPFTFKCFRRPSVSAQLFCCFWVVVFSGNTCEQAI